MKKILFLTLIAFLLIGLGNVEAQYGNTKKKKRKKPEKKESNEAQVKRESESTFVDNLWYGLNIGNLQFGSNYFSLGVGPMVGYRVIDQLSVGMLVKLDYVYIKGAFIRDNQFETYRFSTLDIGPTIFARYKFLDQFFVQAEYERASFQREQRSGSIPVIIDGKVQKERYGENYLYVGVGYGGGYPFGTYVSLHYNILDEITSTRIPFDYRIGLTWNF